MSSEASGRRKAQALGGSARAALFWSVAFTLFRDVLQFATMLVLVRLLTPDEYGRMSLAQSMHGIIYVVSFSTFASHALQLRNPSDIDWDAHFTAGVITNAILFVVVVGLACILSTIPRYSGAALPLAVLGSLYVVDVPATLRQRMLEAHHDWKRSRMLLMIGSALAAGSGLAIALASGGVLALAVQPTLLILPAAVDLFLAHGWRPEWQWSWRRYRESARFGANRMGPAGLFYSRQFVEQALFAGSFNLAVLGVYSRSIGLATLFAGRTGQIMASTLYPVLTRAEQGSERFQRNAGLLLQGVIWSTVPGAALIALAASDVVALLYGQKWLDVVPLLGLAAAAVSFIGINHAAYNLLLANCEQSRCLRLDIVSAVIGFGVAFALIPWGAAAYMAGLTVHGAIMLALNLKALIETKGIDHGSTIAAVVPPLVAVALAVAVVVSVLGTVSQIDSAIVRLGMVGVLFCATYAAALRGLFARQTALLVEVAPGGQLVRRLLHL